MKSRPKKPKPEDGWNLQAFSEMLDRQSEKRIAQDKEDLQKLKEEFQKFDPSTMDSETLLTLYAQWYSRGCADPRQTEVYQDFAQVAKDELKKRIGNNKP